MVLQVRPLVLYNRRKSSKDLVDEGSHQLGEALDRLGVERECSEQREERADICVRPRRLLLHKQFQVMEFRGLGQASLDQGDFGLQTDKDGMALLSHNDSIAPIWHAMSVAAVDAAY